MQWETPSDYRSKIWKTTIRSHSTTKIQHLTWITAMYRKTFLPHRKISLIQEKKYELIKLEEGDFSLDVHVSSKEDTVWLTQGQMVILFNRDTSVISRHISNILKDKKCTESNF